MATECTSPAAMATATLPGNAGTRVWLNVLSPHATIWPVDSSASEWLVPPATATTLDLALAGTAHCRHWSHRTSGAGKSHPRTATLHTPSGPDRALTWLSPLLPQHSTPPALVTASECVCPAAMATTLDRAPAGTLHCPLLLKPKQATVPFLSSTKVWSAPAAMAVTLLRAKAGTMLRTEAGSPSGSPPQLSTAPALVSATEWSLLAETATTPESAARGTAMLPLKSVP